MTSPSTPPPRTPSGQAAQETSTRIGASAPPSGAALPRRGPGAVLWTAAAPLIALALALLFLASSGDITGREAAYPRLLAVLVSVLAVFSIVNDLREARAERATAAESGLDLHADAEDDGFEGRRGAGVHVRRVLLFIALTVLSVYLMNVVGFFLPAFLLLGGGLVVLGVRSPWRVVAYTVGLVGVAYLLFVQALQVPFPPAPWS